MPADGAGLRASAGRATHLRIYPQTFKRGLHVALPRGCPDGRLVSTVMTSVSPDQLPLVVQQVREALTPLADQDWSTPARDLEWTCHQTAVHIADSYFATATQITAQPQDDWVPAGVSVEPDVPPIQLLQVIEACAGLLQSAASCADPSLRAWHPHGTADPSGWVAMGIVDGLVHTWDISTTLGSSWLPPTNLCAPVIERLFPDAPQGFNPAEALLWCTGRIALTDHPRQDRTWRWHSSPL